MPTARILYLEDDIGVASPTKAVLEQKGYSVSSRNILMGQFVI